jgi:(1->4)-alpha-D-glucan 1-alpha-D-glucosylmutase
MTADARQAFDDWAVAAIGAARIPTSTYRLQLNASFGFADVEALVPYFELLGVGAVYLSPVLRARSASPHGYDTVDYGALNPELGGEAAFESMVGSIRARGLGLVLDIVPNHMSVDAVENRAWRDVLENGPSALHADWFDIDWEPVKAALAHKVLLPILGDQYGTVLERGEIQLACHEGAFEIHYGSHRLPFNPELVPLVFEGITAALNDASIDPESARELADILASFGRLPPYTVRDRARRDARRHQAQAAAARLARLLASDAAVSDVVARAVASINGRPGDPESFDRLHTLLEHQAYRLAYWRTAFDEINYRRFFDVNELAAVRMEDPRVFAAAHHLVMELVGRGLVTGLRVDHPDGLADPEEYFERLQDAAWVARARAALGADGDADRLAELSAWRASRCAEEPRHWTARPVYVVAEKIVTPGEPFPAWAMHGGTGYRFLNHVNGLFVDRAGLHRIERSWARRTGSTMPFSEIAFECRRLIARTAMASEMNMIAHELETIAGADRGTRDFTLNSLRQVLREVIASFPVYRTYVSDRGVAERDRAVVLGAVAEARRRSPVMDASIFEFMEEVLVPDVQAGAGPARLRLAMRVQQLTGPIQAKGMEDTAFYRYTPLIAVNEVGSHPAEPTLSVDDFHAANRGRLGRDPATMTTLTTHDTKRSGDARARLAAISERAADWTRAVASWSKINAPHRIRNGSGRCPDAEDENHLYQALLAIWPTEDDGVEFAASVPTTLVERLEGYLIKAVREAKRRSNWLRPDEEYERGLLEFTRAITRGPGARRFLAAFVPFARTLGRHGAVNSLAQVALWLGSPGVPDVYQGSEAWHFHLVDPDNRRPVDFARHADRLNEMASWLDRAESATPDAEVTAFVSQLVACWHDGAIKTWCLAAGLRHRKQDPALFLEGDYVAIAPDPPETPVVAFARTYEGRAVIVAVPRLAGRLMKDGAWPRGEAWGDSTLVLPPGVPAGRLFDRVTARRLATRESESGLRLSLASVLALAPFAWIEVAHAGENSADSGEASHPHDEPTAVG